jgi:hypothetical protein
MARPSRQADCHPERKHSGKGLCKQCYRAQYTYPDPEKRKRACKEWYAKNKDRAKAYKAAWKERNPDYHANYTLVNLHTTQRKAGWTAALTDTLWSEQNGKCKICQRQMTKPIRGKVLATSAVRDHDHEKSYPRALICSTCNIVLGHYEKQLRPFLTLQPFETYLNEFSERRHDK